jgi:multiple sugar transport system substrate-binding protein
VGGADAYLPASWSTTMIEGSTKVYAIPWFVDARALFYRKDALKAAGVDPSEAFQNWATFKAALQKVNGMIIDGQRMSALGIPGKHDWNVLHNIFPWVWGSGGEVYSSSTKEPAFNSDKATEGILYYTGLANEGLVDASSLYKNTGQIESDFADGKAAMIISGPWMIKSLTIPRDQGGLGDKLAASNYGVALLPAGPAGRATFIGGSNLAVFKSSKHKAAAWQFIAYLSSDEAQLTYSKLSGMLPAKRSVINSPVLTQDSGYAAFAEAVKYGKSFPSIPQWGPTETALVNSFSGIWDIVAEKAGSYSKETVKKQLDAAAKEVKIIWSQ